MIRSVGPTARDPLAALPPAGRTSSALREARALSRDVAMRRRTESIVLEGVHLAEEALRDPGRIRAAFASPRLLRDEAGRAIADRLSSAPFPAHRVDDRVLGSAVDVEAHQGILLIVNRPRFREADLLPRTGAPLILVACGVQDPGNVGALARIAEAAWATGMICAGAGADPYAPRPLRASAGSLLRLPLLEFAEADRAIAELRRLGIRLIGASPRSTLSYRDESWIGPIALLFGGEGAGLEPRVQESLDCLVRIPMRDGVDSLNVAAAAAVLMFEAASRRTPA